MAIDFPTSPSLGQVYPAAVSPGDVQWLWNGSGWQKVANLGQIVSVFYTFTPVEDDVYEFPWLVTNDFQTFTYI